ncbi:MAG: gluconate 2-dehydrogenase subunit 3 family protein [Acidobacteria bacterium]|nr:gluconate 2-dehydrogenase subunit 3 family protein [Acidobacteriota bacterium]
MKRRRWLQSVAVLPALQGLAPTAEAQRATPAPSGSNEFPLLPETTADAVAGNARRFFSPEQFAALSKLAGLMVPRFAERPGAEEAGAAEFLDFLVKASPLERQLLYKTGLDRLNSEARRRYQRAFAEVNAAEAKAILEPLQKQWTYAAPVDAFARFLRQAKDDLLQATVNSREYAIAMQARSRSAGGMNAYWLPLD